MKDVERDYANNAELLHVFSRDYCNAGPNGLCGNRITVQLCTWTGDTGNDGEIVLMCGQCATYYLAQTMGFWENAGNGDLPVKYLQGALREAQ